MQVIREAFVHALVTGRRHEGRDDEVDVAEEEEDYDGEGGADGRLPVPFLAVQVEVDEAACYEDVYDGQRVRDYVEDEVVGVAWRWCKHDDNGDKPVLEETSKWGVEWTVAGPEAGEGEDAFAAEFLDKSALREDYAQDVAKRREGDEDREGALGFGAEDVAEEGGGYEAF